MLEAIDHLDKAIFLFLNGLHQDWLDTPMRYITEMRTWIPFYACIGVFSLGTKYQRKCYEAPPSLIKLLFQFENLTLAFLLITC